MGFFSDLKMMGDVVKACVDMGVADFKACDQMTKLIEEARDHKSEAGFLTASDLNCIREYDAAKEANANHSSNLSTEAANKLVQAEEDKQVACMKSFQLNRKFSQEFRDSCKEAVALYTEAAGEDKLFGTIEESMIKNYKFKDEKEKAFVHELFEVSKQSSVACDQMVNLIDEARTSAFLTAEGKKAIAEYDAANAAYTKNKSNKKAADLTAAMEGTEVACMEIFQKNPKFTMVFRGSCKNAVKLYNDAEAAIEKLKDYEL